MKKIFVLAIAFALMLSVITSLPVMAAVDKSLLSYNTSAKVVTVEKSTGQIYINGCVKALETVKKGNTITLKPILDPENKNAKITWTSSNPKIAKVSSSGKVTALAQGTVMIYIKAKNYDDTWCFVKVQGSSKDPKLIGSSDDIFYYDNIKFSATDSFKKIKSLIPELDYYEDWGLSNGSEDYNKAHTFLEGDNKWGMHIIAKSKSPVKTNRDIKIGDKKSKVLTKYGLPTSIFKDDDFDGGEAYSYEMNTYVDERIKTRYISFTFAKSKDTVSKIHYYWGLASYW